MTTQPDWLTLSRALDPWRVLTFEELGDLYVAPPYSPVGQMTRRLRAFGRTRRTSVESVRAPKFLFCGARGSGKTTQIRRLFLESVREHETLLLDLGSVMPERVSTLQIVVHFGLALLSRLSDYHPGQDAHAFVASFAPARTFSAVLREFVGEIDLGAVVDGIKPVLVAADLASGGTVSTVATMVKTFKGTYQAFKEKTAPVHGLSRASKLMTRLAGDDLGAAETLVSEVNAIAQALEATAGRAPLILFEGLDKILELKDVLLAFDDVELLRKLEPAVVISGPTTLRHDVRFAGLSQDLEVGLVHNLPVVTREGGDNPAGVSTLLSILAKRLGHHENTIDDDVARRAARLSSGIPRVFFKILNEAALIAESRMAGRVGLDDLQEAVKEMRLALQQPLTRSDVVRLGEILRTAKVGNEDRDQQLLYENLVACYPNEDAWFRPNEILVDWVRREYATAGAVR